MHIAYTHMIRVAGAIEQRIGPEVIDTRSEHEHAHAQRIQRTAYGALFISSALEFY